MSAKSKPSLGRGIAAAFVLSACGAALLAASTPLLGSATALRAVIALLGFSYVVYSMGSSSERVGRVSTVVAWSILASIVWFAELPLGGYVLVHVGLLGLVRALYHYSSSLPALADLALSLLGTAFGVWAAQRSGSAWLALWCFFLVQAFHVLIPATLTQRATGAPAAPDDAFARAHRAAEAAARRLSSSTR
jgi:hypothetical protein